jgi:hypothetical protein
VLYWNALHDWVSLAFQSSRRVGAIHGCAPRYLLLLVATQFALLTPYVFVVTLGALSRGARHAWEGRLDDRTRLLLLSGVVPIVLFMLACLRSLVKLSSLAPAYWSSTILGVDHLLSLAGGTRRLVRGLASSAVLLGLALIVTAIPKLPLRGGFDTWSGWDEGARWVDKVAASARADGHEVFVFAPEYRASSMLRFYLPGQPRTYAQDIYGEPALQLDHFPLPSNLKGATGILVIAGHTGRAFDLQRLASYCGTIERVDEVETRGFGKAKRRTEIYRCTGYHGHPSWLKGKAHRSSHSLGGRSCRRTRAGCLPHSWARLSDAPCRVVRHTPPCSCRTSACPKATDIGRCPYREIHRTQAPRSGLGRNACRSSDRRSSRACRRRR